jgi:hypothetical protein
MNDQVHVLSLKIIILQSYKNSNFCKNCMRTSQFPVFGFSAIIAKVIKKVTFAVIKYIVLIFNQ